MSAYTTIKLTNNLRENGGEWFAAAITDYHRRVLEECRTEEPNAGWKLQTRGMSATWHDIGGDA
jgi:hypothetical protein